MRDMRYWADKALLVLAASIITLLVVELLLQIIYPAHGSWRLHRIPDRELGWVLEPGAEFSRQLPAARVSVRYNSEGFRDSEHSAPPPGDAIRIVVLGDSFMEANMVPLEHVFHKQLEQRAASKAQKVATYNFGVAGYGTLQEYMTLKKAGVKRKPDLVLLAFFMHNDVRNNAQHLNLSAIAKRRGMRRRPYLDEVNDSEWRVLKPSYEMIREQFLQRKNSLFFRIKYGSVLLSLIRNARRAFKSRSKTFNDGGSLAMHVCGNTPPFEKGWRTTERILRRLRDEVKAIGARLVVFSVPALFDADLEFAKDMERTAKTKDLALCVEGSPAYRHLSKVLERNEIAYIDLVPDFRKAVTNEGRQLFVRGDWHWNAEGHALAARAIHNALMSRGYLSK